MIKTSTVQDCFRFLTREAKGFYLTNESTSVSHLSHEPSPVEFYREWVSPNRPCIIKNSLDHWSAIEAWSSDYFREKIGTNEVSVAVTPNGLADAVHEGKFVLPEERTMKFEEFLDIMDSPEEHNGIFYIQKQNSNLINEYSELICDIQKDLPWATEAFGQPPDAVNFWFGDERAVTSMHRDYYENLYCVIKGYKTFTILPPTDLPFVPYGTYDVARFKENEKGKFDIIDEKNADKVPWIPVDPLRPDLCAYPEFAETRPVMVTVHAGEILYLPSLWFHHVQQSHGCLAVNYWYDMDYGIKHNHYTFLEKLVQEIKCGDK